MPDERQDEAGSSGVRRGARGERARFSSVPDAALDPGAEEPASGRGGVRGERAGPSSVAAARSAQSADSARPHQGAQVVTAAVLEGQENIIAVLREINASIRQLADSVNRVCSALEARPPAH